MAFEITVAEVRDGFTSTASDADITAYIAFADQADTCLTNNEIAEALGKQLKILLVRHLATNARDGGSITSERAVSGASRAFGEFPAGETGFLDTLRRLDRTSCVYMLAENNAPIQFRSIGRSSRNRNTW